MSYHIVSISASDCSISVNCGQLIVRDLEKGIKSLPLEDISSIIITSYSAKIHSSVFVKCAKFGVSVVLCDSFKPVSLMLPANRSSDTLLTKATLILDKKRQASLWKKTVDAKCRNQYFLSSTLCPNFEKRERFNAEVLRDSGHKESTCAQYYWRAWGLIIGDKAFKRHSLESASNNFLNYGYAVLLSTVLQKLFACGLDPTFGISHAIRERSTPLAYDLMEPFRPLIDWRVAQWIGDFRESGEHPELNKEYKRWVTGILNQKITYLKTETSVSNCIEAVIRSFRKSVLDQSVREYKPWILKNLKWDG